MWCDKCGEGTPVIASAEDPNIHVCVQCKRSYYLHSGLALTAVPHSRPRGLTPVVDLLVSPLLTLSANDASLSVTDYAVHKPHAGARNERPPQSHYDKHRIVARAERQQRRRGRSSMILWTAMTLGIGLFTCGATLVAMSLTGGALDLWKIGTPLVLAGQALLFVGLALQLDILGQHQHNGTVAGRIQQSSRVRRVGSEAIPGNR